MKRNLAGVFRLFWETALFGLILAFSVRAQAAHLCLSPMSDGGGKVRSEGVEEDPRFFTFTSQSRLTWLEIVQVMSFRAARRNPDYSAHDFELNQLQERIEELSSSPRLFDRNLRKIETLKRIKFRKIEGLRAFKANRRRRLGSLPENRFIDSADTWFLDLGSVRAEEEYLFNDVLNEALFRSLSHARNTRNRQTLSHVFKQELLKRLGRLDEAEQINLLAFLSYGVHRLDGLELPQSFLMPTQPLRILLAPEGMADLLLDMEDRAVEILAKQNTEASFVTLARALEGSRLRMLERNLYHHGMFIQLPSYAPLLSALSHEATRQKAVDALKQVRAEVEAKNPWTWANKNAKNHLRRLLGSVGESGSPGDFLSSRKYD